MDPIEIGKNTQVDTSADHVVIQKMLEDIPGGRSLDVTGVTDEVLKAGRIIIEADASGDLKPLGITSGAYDSLPANHTYKGVLLSSVLLTKPFASVMVRGTVNDKAAQEVHELPPVTSTIKSALPLIRFINS